MKLKVLILALACLLPAMVQAQNVLTYTTNGGAITITGYVGPQGGVTNVVIPAALNGYPVKSINFNSFFACSSLTNVTIPPSVTNIGYFAFWSCTSLPNVTIPASVTSIGNGTFQSCGSLTNIEVAGANPAYSSVNGVLFNKAQTTLIQFPGGLGGSYIIPGSVTSLGSGAFYGCPNLTGVMIPSSVTSIGGNPAFGNCPSLMVIDVAGGNPTYGSLNGVLFNKTQTTLIQFPGGFSGSYSVPNSVTNLGSWAFSYCPSLASVAIPGSVTSLGDSTFYSCSSLTNVTIPNSVTRLGNYTFQFCTSLASLPIPGSVTNIGIQTFSYCYGLRGVTIPSSVTSIGDYAFGSCTVLTNLTFLGNAPSLGTSVFSSVAVGAKVYYYSGTTGWGATYGGLPTTILSGPPPSYPLTYTTNNGAITITGYTGPQGGVTNVVIPATLNGYPVTSVGTAAFSACYNLTNVVIPNSVTNIGNNAFGNCTNLTNLSFLGNAPVLGSSVFLNVPGTVYYYYGTTGWSATYGGLPTVMLGGAPLSNPLTYTTNGGTITITGHIGPSSDVTNVVVPATINGYPVVAIGNYAFYYCTNLPSVVIGSTVTSIGSGAFSSCYNLTNVVIPNGVTNIGASAFDSCYKLSSVTIPASVTTIGNPPFASCYGLTNISVDAANAVYSSLNGVLFDKAQTTLVQFPPGLSGSYVVPASVTSIATVAFGTCSGLTSVVIPASVTNIGSFAFSLCFGLKSMVIPASVMNIRSSTFQGCAGLTNLMIGNNVTNIGNNAFSSCSGLTSVSIPASVTSIGNASFSSCSNLTNLTFLGNTPSLGLDPFSGGAAFATVYYYYGTTGWGTAYGGLPTYMLGAPAPQIGGGGSIEVQSGNFGFNVTGVINQIVVVEASTNLVNWQPVWTNTLTAATTNFTDPQWANFPARYYRAR